MVDSVHIWSYHDNTQPSINCFGNPNVAVVELGCRIQHHFEDNNCHGWRTDQRDCRQFDPDGNDNFDGMKAIAGSDVDIEISVMHPVETPENRQKMEEHMLEIYDEVEGHDSRDELDPVWQVNDVQDAPTALLGYTVPDAIAATARVKVP